jgi:ribonuclease P protein component
VPGIPAKSLTPRLSFPGTARLRSPAEFAPALKGRRLAKGALFVLSAAPNASESRLGLVIGKRFAPLSVSRSAIKRVLREAFRLKRPDLPSGDYVVRLHARIGVVSLTVLKHDVRQEIDAHLLRAARSQNGARPGPAGS